MGVFFTRQFNLGLAVLKKKELGNTSHEKASNKAVTVT